VSYCATCDGPFFKGKRIFVSGGGDAACDEAMFLAKLSDKVTVVHRKDRFRAQRALAERVLSNPNITVRFNTVVKEVRGEKKVETLVLEKTDSGTTEEVGAEALFVFVGSIPQTALALEATLDEAGFVVTDDKMATSVPGLYAVGDLRATPFRQVVTACAEAPVNQ